MIGKIELNSFKLYSAQDNAQTMMHESINGSNSVFLDRKSSESFSFQHIIIRLWWLQRFPEIVWFNNQIKQHIGKQMLNQI